MDLPFSNNTQTNSLNQKDSDPARYDAIAAKLCDKRKLLEEKSHSNEVSQQEKEDLALLLIQIKQDMATFGISEIDYQAYLASKEVKETSSQEGQTVAAKSEEDVLVEPD